MRLRITFIAFLVISTSCFVSEADDVQKTPRAINSSLFAGFEKCRGTRALSAALDSLIAEEVPIKKENNAWTYNVTTEVMGLPVKEIQIGICSPDGARDCGWGSYLSLTIAMPFKEARSHLKKLMGIDFTQEKRDKEFEVTLRPVLATSEADGETVLFCDPGTL